LATRQYSGGLLFAAKAIAYRAVTCFRTQRTRKMHATGALTSIDCRKGTFHVCDLPAASLSPQFWGQFIGCSEPSKAQVTVSQLKRYVRDVIRDFRHCVQRADLRIDLINLYYDFGHFIRPQACRQHPTTYPAASQFQVECFELLPAGDQSSRRILETHLARAEAIIAKELSLISTYSGSRTTYMPGCASTSNK